MEMTRFKWRATSNLSSNFAAVFLASLVVPLLTGDFDLSKWYVVLFGLALTVFFIWLSLVSADKGKL